MNVFDAACMDDGFIGYLEELFVDVGMNIEELLELLGYEGVCEMYLKYEEDFDGETKEVNESAPRYYFSEFRYCIHGVRYGDSVCEVPECGMIGTEVKQNVAETKVSDCRYDVECTNPKCKRNHPNGRTKDMNCRYGDKCTDSKCKWLHSSGRSRRRN